MSHPPQSEKKPSWYRVLEIEGSEYPSVYAVKEDFASREEMREKFSQARTFLVNNHISFTERGAPTLQGATMDACISLVDFLARYAPRP